MADLFKYKKRKQPDMGYIQRKPFFSNQQDVPGSHSFFGRTNDAATAHINGPPDPTPKQPAPVPKATPCPTSVSIGSVRHSNHGDLSAADKEKFRTYIEAYSTMNVGPGPDHTGHCMKEKLTTVFNNCPAQVFSRGGETDSQPCTGNKCLDVNRFGSGPTAFIDMHRTKTPGSLLEGSGVNSCSVVCEQEYSCDRISPTMGVFRITRNYKADTFTKPDGTQMHITTGDIQKENAAPVGDFNITDEIRHTA